jgi:hypothetical protein
MLSELAGTINKGFPDTFEPTRNGHCAVVPSYAAKMAPRSRPLAPLAQAGSATASG